MRLPLLILLATAAPAAAADWTLDSALAAARPSAERLAAEALLATAARDLALSRSVVLDGVALTVEAGPRRSAEDDGSDLAVGVEMPLAGDRAERQAAIDLFAEAEQVLRAAADLEAGLALRLAYVDAWEATEGLALARRQAAGAESWREVVEARVAAGAEAPYEASLVVAELGLARLALAEAREQAQLAWSELLARAAVGPVPTRIAEPRLSTLPVLVPAGDEPGIDSGRVGSLLARAVELRFALARALVSLDAARRGSRWSLLAIAAQEGEEDVARLGVGYRLPLAGQNAARTTARDAALAEQARAAELERARLEGRLRGAKERAAALEGSAPLTTQEIEDALTALEARVTTGRDRPSVVLPLRRQLVGAFLIELRARAALARAAFQIHTLTAEISR